MKIKPRALISALTLSVGSIALLTVAQASDRRHLITPVDALHKGRSDDRHLPFVANSLLYFKAGEVIGFEGDVSRLMQAAFGLSEEDMTSDKSTGRKGSSGRKDKADTDALAAAIAKAHQEGRAEMLAEVLARTDILDALDDAQAAALDKAQADVDGLRDLVA